MTARRALTPLVLLTLLAPAPALAQAARSPRARVRPTTWALEPALPVHPEREVQGPAARALAHYHVPAQRFPVHLGPPHQVRKVVSREVTFPSAVQTRWPVVHGTYYAPCGVSGRAPAAVVVHHLGGSFGAERVLAQFLAVNGVAAFFISLPNYGARREPGTRQGFLRLPPVLAFKTFQQAVLDVIRAGDFLRSRPEVDPQRVGAVGVSLGAFVTAVARGVDPRLGRTVLVLGGGDLGLMVQDAPEVSRVLKKAGISPRLLSTILTPVDPVTFAHRIDPADVLMIAARQDEIVPTACTQALWKAIGRPRIRWFDCGHYGIVLHLPVLMDMTLDHLRGGTHS